MAALFYNTTNTSIFQGGYQINTSVRIPFIDNLVGVNGFAIVNEVSVQNADNVQFFLTFDDFVQYFYFGRGIGSISITGTMLMNCDGLFPGIDIFYNSISRFRGQPVLVSFGSAVFTGVITTFSTSAVPEEAPIIQFNITLSIIDHSLASPNFPSVC